MKKYDYEQLHKLLKPLRQVSLSRTQKDEMRKKIFEYVSFNPIRSAQTAQSSNYFSVPERMFVRFASALLMVIFAGGSVALAAESAMPGDSLYGVKTGFNEELMELASISLEAKARTQSVIAQRRIREAEKLAAQGELDQNVSKEIEEQVAQRSDRMRQYLTQLHSEGQSDEATEIGSNFESTLSGHLAVLEDIAVRHEQEHERLRGAASMTAQSKQFGNDVRAIVDGIRKVADSLAASSSPIMNTSEVSVAQENITDESVRRELERSATQLQDLQRMFNELKAGMSQNLERQVTAALNQAVSAIDQAIRAYQNDRLTEARTQLKNATRAQTRSDVILRSYAAISDSHIVVENDQSATTTKPLITTNASSSTSTPATATSSPDTATSSDNQATSSVDASVKSANNHLNGVPIGNNGTNTNATTSTSTQTDQATSSVESTSTSSDMSSSRNAVPVKVRGEDGEVKYTTRGTLVRNDEVNMASSSTSIDMAIERVVATIRQGLDKTATTSDIFQSE